MKVIVLKVCISCQKCKTQILRAVTKLEGIVEVSVDEKKGTLRVVGAVDPVQVATQVRKTGKTAVLDTVSDPKPPDKPPPVKPPPKENPTPPCPPTPCPLPPCCSACRVVEVHYAPDCYDGSYCSIM